MPTASAPEFVRIRIAHSIDVAVNFPAAILTIIAFMNPDVVPLGPPWIGLNLLAVAICLGIVALGSVKHAGWYKRWSIWIFSPVTVALIVANVAGLITAVARQ